MLDRRLLAVCGLGVTLLHVSAAAAESPGTSARATQHALAEAENLCAQHPSRCPATPTPTLTLTQTPTLTPTPMPTATDSPTNDPTGTPTDVPCWLTDPDVGDPDNGYIVFDDQGAPVPCPDPTEAAEDDATSEPTPTLAVLPTIAAARPRSQPAAVAVVATSPAQPIEPQPTYTPYPTYTPQPTYTVVPSLTSTPRTIPTATLTPTATATITATVVPLGLAASPPVRSALSAADRTHWSWAAFLGYLAAAIGVVMLIVAFVTRRRVAVWKPRAQKGAQDARP